MDKHAKEPVRTDCDTLLGEPIRFAAQSALSALEIHNFRTENAVVRAVKTVAGSLLIQVDVAILGIPKERLVLYRRYPSDWWQAFKERWFPRWVLACWPVRYEEIVIDRTLYAAVCPHLIIDTRSTHLKWLLQKQQDAQAERSPR